ncbi:MAG: rhamnulokinase [Armatimonadota bacterium]|nr:rhamnulokinase [Armatimonadota bacterium]
MANYLALDLGAESGRGVLGKLEGDRLEIQEVHRWANRPAALPDGIHWDILGQFNEIKTAIAAAGRHQASPLQGIAVDTWGVDYALLDQRGDLLGVPFHYRDHRTDGVMDRVFSQVSKEEIFNWTGIQFMQLNTLFQLAAAREQNSPALDAAHRLLFLPDLFHYWLSGEQTCEFTVASTSQLYNPQTSGWAVELMDRLRIPSHLFLPVTPPGVPIGKLRPAIAEETRAGDVPILTVGCHDTASAVAAVPAIGDDFIYLSSGTWSLMGVELARPLISPEALAANFTNEGGVAHTIRFLKNIMGLWVVQECRRSWARQGHEYSYGELTTLAAAAEPFQHFINPDDPSFLAPPDMPGAIIAYCDRTGQGRPAGPGPTIRACLEGLAFQYRENVARLESLVGRSLPTLHIVGGGVQNRLLCQFAANATGKTVVAGPVEATAAGNLLVQAMARSEIGSLRDLRHIVRNSFPVEEYTPFETAAWEEAWGRWRGCVGV